jgi:ribosomal protein S18 acetylase RimI-like enzyme
MSDQYAEALVFLERDLLKHITPLKLLHAYGSAVTCCYLERGDSAGALLMLPPQLFPSDAADYPFADQIVLLSTTGPAAAAALLDLVPQGKTLIFKLVDPADREAVARRFSLSRVTGFSSYTSPPGRPWPPADDVAVSEALDERSLALFVARGHDADEVRGHFCAGVALSCMIEVAGAPAAVCYCYQNYGPVWEIAGVYTAPAARRAGYGRRVVAAALHSLTGRGLTPRYHVREDNLPSVRLAETLGLTPFVTIEHFLHSGAAP